MESALNTNALAQLPDLMIYALGAAAALLVGLLALVALDLAYLLTLIAHVSRHVMGSGSRRSAAALAMLLAVAGSASPALQQQTSAPTIEPRFTRIFGADSLHIGAAAPSPDGRWVVFSNEEGPQAYNLWVVSASGGEPIRVTSGRYTDNMPAWFPSGERIAFRSDRTGTSSILTTISIDPRTARPTGLPRQVSLDRVWSYAISPDGNQIVYYTRRDSTSRVVVVPATGGTSRTLLEYGGSITSISHLRWTSDGEWIYYSARAPAQPVRTLYRVRASGGTPQELPGISILLPSTGPFHHISADGRYLLTRIDQGTGSSQPVFLLVTTDGRPLARFALRRNSMPTGFTPDGRGIIVVQSNIVAPIRVVPVAGGPVRQLTEAREYDWPLGWSADGSRAFIQTQANGHQAILAVPVGGGAATEFVIPDEAKIPIGISSDGRYLRYTVGDDPSARLMRIRRLADGQTREIAAPLVYPMYIGSVSGPGGGYATLGDAFYDLARRADRLELWATPVEGAPRLLRSFPFSYAGRTGFGVHGDRIAYRERRGDSTALFVTQGRNGRPRHLATVVGDANAGTWSHNGRWLAWDYYPPGDNPRYAVLLVGLDASGAPSGPPRILEAGPMWGWQIQWLPNDDAFTVFGMTGTGSETHVYLVSLREGERPVALTRDDPSVRWGYELSPDGRYVAYPAEIPRGSSIWRVDLSEVLARADGGGGARRR